MSEAWGFLFRAVALLGVVFAAYIALATPGFEGVTSMLAGLVVSGVGVALECRRRKDRSVFGQLGFVLLFTMLIPSIACFAAEWTAPRIFSIALLMSSFLAFAAVGRSGSERLKGIQNFAGAVELFESHDVQFAVLAKQAPVGPGGVVEVMVFAQNCVDGPRGITVKVLADEERGVAAQRHDEDLDRGSIVAFKLSVPVPKTATNQFRFMVDVLGYGGTPARRVRHSTGKHWVNLTEADEKNAAGLVGLAVVGHGSLQLGINGLIIVPVDALQPQNVTAQPVMATAVYRPSATELAAAAG